MTQSVAINMRISFKGQRKGLTARSFRYQMATNDGVSCVARQAFAVGRMIEYGALGAMTAHARTRVHTLLVDTSARFGTVGVDNTLGSALHIGISVVFGHTLAGGGAIAFFAEGVQATGTGSTGLYCFNRCCEGYRGWDLSEIR